MGTTAAANAMLSCNGVPESLSMSGSMPETPHKPAVRTLVGQGAPYMKYAAPPYPTPKTLLTVMWVLKPAMRERLGIRGQGLETLHGATFSQSKRFRQERLANDWPPKNKRPPEHGIVTAKSRLSQSPALAQSSRNALCTRRGSRYTPAL